VTELVERHYLPLTQDARRRLFAGAGDPLVGDTVSAPEFELFLIAFSSRGVRMTEPVESWIRRAGQRCHEVGLERLGRALQKHAEHEANHHLMMIEDTHLLVKRWNDRHDRALDAQALLDMPPLPATEDYVNLHEDVIRSRAPFAQLAIEFEIEGLSVSLGPKLMQQCERLLGREALQGLSFLREHVAVDAGHTLFNMQELERLLTAKPDAVEPLGAAGSAALDAYAGFLSGCLSWARDTWAEMSQPRAANA
jgi:hypothetical protein